MLSVRGADGGSGPEARTAPEAAVPAGAAPEDAALVVAARAGDARASATLVRRHLRKAMAVAIEYVRTREDAEDVVQDAFRSAFANLDGFDVRRPFGPWFFTIVRNAARNRRASGRLRAHAPLESAEPAAPASGSPLESARRRELREGIEAAIEALPPGQRMCFLLCVVEELSAAEAARATGLAESTVRVHVFLARRALRVLLERWREEA